MDQEKLKIIKTLEELKELETYLQDKEYVAYDIETTGLEKDSTIIGFSISVSTESGFYVSLFQWDNLAHSLRPNASLAGAISFIQSLVDKKLIMHNAVFDCSRTRTQFGIDLMPSVHTDTLMLGHLLNENRSNGLKERAVELYGEDASKEQRLMKASILKNGGEVTKGKYELYKADEDLIGEYGAKDAILTLKLFYNDVPELYAQGLNKFFYEDETMPLLRGPTYDLNTEGVRVDPVKLEKLKGSLEAECQELRGIIYHEIDSLIKENYPGTNKTNIFNINSGSQIAWLLYHKMGKDFSTLTDSGKEVCKALSLKFPYSPAARREFIAVCQANKGRIYGEAKLNKAGKMGKPKTVKDFWFYASSDKTALAKHKKIRWVESLLKYNKNMKLLSTYVEGIQERMRYNILQSDFLQHGTTSGRYASRNPNLQNLPRDEKRIKECLVARPGKILIGADHSQLEPRIFASYSQDERLMQCFKDGDDFYSVIGVEVFNKEDCSLKKKDKDSFAVCYPTLRDIAKVIALSITYGTTAPKMSPAVGKSIEECQYIIDRYLEKFPSVYNFMLDSHCQAIESGVVYNLFGRPRRMPEAMKIPTLYGSTSHSELPYVARNVLNLAVNHRIQSTAASIMNRGSIEFKRRCQEKEKLDKSWKDVKIVLQIHDELWAEAPEHLGEEVKQIMKISMETAVTLPGVDLIAEPKICKNVAELK